MTESKSDLSRRLLETFKVEAEEHISALTAGLIAIEKGADPDQQAKVIETLFREAHSLKGASRVVNLRQIGDICQAMESLFAAAKAGQLTMAPEVLDALHRANDAILDSLRALDRIGKESGEKSRELVRSLEFFLLPSQPERGAPSLSPLPPQAPVETAPSSHTVRISAERISAVLRHAEELLSEKIASRERLRDLKELEEFAVSGVKEKGDFRSGLKSHFSKLSRRSESDFHHLSNMVDQLLDDVKMMMLLPFHTLLETFPKFVRDLAREQGKEANLIIQGEEIEVDRRILEEMKDPILHLVRNALDHGIEKPEERVRKGKPACGKIELFIVPKEGGKIELTVRDDGGGMDVEKIRQKGIELGLIKPKDPSKLSWEEVLETICRSGFSTSSFITDISGRGLGLAIVREKVERLNGKISLETEADKGSLFRLLLPMTMSTFRGTFIKSQGHLFVIPTARVERVLRVHKENIQTVEDRETVELDGNAVSLANLGNVLDLAVEPGDEKGEGDYRSVIVLAAAENRLAFSVDAIEEEKEVLVKTWSHPFSHIRSVTGATVIGAGQVVPVLNAAELIQTAIAKSEEISRESEEPVMTAEKKSILVVEDSITTRTLLKNIIESAGYEVKTAVDGQDAYTQLAAEHFDLIVSDIDMPRLDGFELTSKVRNHKTLADLPIVLVTALESRDDRQRGMEVGANAYIVKSSFDQSNLLEIIHQLA
ncbi:MAG: response regulator [Deltaproteobacteria bacterium]|nr:response regulator [Deltaproteobacteria bacterium]